MSNTQTTKLLTRHKLAIAECRAALIALVNARDRYACTVRKGKLTQKREADLRNFAQQVFDL